MFPSGIYLYNCEQQISSHMLSWSKSVISDIKIKFTALYLFASILTQSVDGEKLYFSIVILAGVSCVSLIYSLPLP